MFSNGGDFFSNFNILKFPGEYCGRTLGWLNRNLKAWVWSMLSTTPNHFFKVFGGNVEFYSKFRRSVLSIFLFLKFFYCFVVSGIVSGR